MLLLAAPPTLIFVVLTWTWSVGNDVSSILPAGPVLLSIGVLSLVRSWRLAARPMLPRQGVDDFVEFLLGCRRGTLTLTGSSLLITESASRGEETVAASTRTL